jgi:hypothetical protein
MIQSASCRRCRSATEIGFIFMASQNRMMTLIAFLQGAELLEPAWTVASSGDDAISQYLPDYQHQNVCRRA